VFYFLVSNNPEKIQRTITMDKSSLKIGINLGGWISQYPAYDHRHFKAFITVNDIKRIAGWGDGSCAPAG